MIVYQLSVYFILIISNDLSEVSINTSVTLSFATVLELFLQTFDRFFLSRFILMSYFIPYIFLQLVLLVLMEGFCCKLVDNFEHEGNSNLKFMISLRLLNIPTVTLY